MFEKKLAQLLFNNVTKDINYYKNKYPKRTLREGAEVTRFAPSPTGYLHIGNFLSAFIDFEIARTTNGVLMFRLEDTDDKREIAGAGLVAINLLREYGIVFDEGVNEKGEQYGAYGPYIQSERKEIYQTFAKHLVEQGKAFPCFCDKAEDIEDVLDRREQQLKETSTLLDHDVCRNLTLEEIEKNLANNKPFAIRLKSTGELKKRLKVYDQIKGERELFENTRDAVLLKSNGIPPYAFAHAVDDFLMGTTLVVRGEEWFPSLPLHIEIFQALSFPLVKYAHTAVICKIGENGNRRKISKRLDAEADMRFFEQMGYPKQAVLEYLLTLANSNFEEWRAKNLNKNIADFPFSIAKMNNSNPIFDIVKLKDISKNVISRMKAEDVYKHVLTWAKSHDKDFYQILKTQKDTAVQLFAVDRYKNNPRKDIAMWSEVQDIFTYIFRPYDDLTIDNSYLEKFDKEIVNQVIKIYAEKFDENQEKNEWFDNVKNLAGQLNFCVDNKKFKESPQLYNGNVADFCGIVRVILTGQNNSPDLYSICIILGKKELLARAEYFVNK